MRFNLKLLLIFFFSGIFHSYSGFGQGNISGTIAGPKGEPLEFVNIILNGKGIGTVSNNLGKFEILNLPFGDYTLKISRIGFLQQERSVRLENGRSKIVVNFQLKESLSSLNEVVVSGTMKEVSKLESPVAVEVYSAKFFQANPNPSLFECLQNVNGVRPQLNCNVCNTGDIHINGLEGPYTMILIDGMPIVSGLSTVYGLTGIPQFLIERVEIVKGPASTLYGSEAVGGLINIITKKPESAPLFAADMFSTNWGDVNSDFGLRYKASEKMEGLLGVNYFNYQNPIDNNDDGFTDVSLQNRFSLFNKLSFKRKDNKQSSLAMRYVYEDRWGGEMDWNEDFRGGDEVYGESIFTNRWEVFGLYELPTLERLKFQYSANGHNQNSVYGETVFIADQYVGFAQISWDKSIERHDILVGGGYRYTYYDDNTSATGISDTENEPSATHLPGVFIQDEIYFNSRNRLLIGARWDFNSLHGSIFSPRINYKWNSYDSKTIIRVGLGNGFRVANIFTEDHAALSGARDVVFAEELDPETSWNANINWVQNILSSSKFFMSTDASVFYTYFNNSILPDYETNPNQIIYSNLEGSAVSKGISLNVDLVLENGLKFLIGSTLMDVSVHEPTRSYRQVLTERFSGIWSIAYTFKNKNLTIDYTGNLYGPMRLPLLGELDNREANSPTFSLQNIQLTKGFGRKWEIFGGLKNLLNFTPPANSIARSFDPFDKDVQFDGDGQVIATPNNPNALTFDPTYVFAPNQGIRGFFGLRYKI